MKGLRIDVVGKAPSILEIKDYNKFLNKRSFVFEGLWWSLFVLAIVNVAFFDSFWVITTSTILWVMAISLFLIIVGWGFMLISLDADERLEFFISPDKCKHLSEIITQHSEFDGYRNQIIAQGREFLQSEYEAFVKIDEKKSCEILYKVGVNI